MQVETGLPKWAGRVPPLDLTGVTVCPRETERRWHKMQPNPKKTYDYKIGNDGLPIGWYHIFLNNKKKVSHTLFPFNEILFVNSSILRK